jgi:hypothetical protein
MPPLGQYIVDRLSGEPVSVADAPDRPAAHEVKLDNAPAHVSIHNVSAIHSLRRECYRVVSNGSAKERVIEGCGEFRAAVVPGVLPRVVLRDVPG